MKNRLIYFFALLLVASSSAAREIEPFVDFHSLSYSEASAAYQMFKDEWKDSPSKNGDTAFSRNRFNVGVRLGSVSIAYHQRHDLLFTFSPDTAEFIYNQKNKIPLPKGQHYNLLLKANWLEADGMRLGFHLPAWQNLSLSTYFYVLNGRSVQLGEIKGQFVEAQQANVPGGYYGEADIHYIYEKDKLLKHNIDRPKGRGYAADIHLSWRYEAYSINAFVEDALFKMKWFDAGFTDGRLNSKNKGYDENGFVSYGALLKGRRGYNDIVQPRISTFSGLEVGYQIDNWQLQANFYRYASLVFPSIGASWQPRNTRQLFSASFEFKSNKLGLGYSWHPYKRGSLGVLVASDRWDYRYAKALETRFTASLLF